MLNFCKIISEYYCNFRWTAMQKADTEAINPPRLQMSNAYKCWNTSNPSTAARNNAGVNKSLQEMIKKSAIR